MIRATFPGLGVSYEDFLNKELEQSYLLHSNNLIHYRMSQGDHFDTKRSEFFRPGNRINLSSVSIHINLGLKETFQSVAGQTLSVPWDIPVVFSSPDGKQIKIDSQDFELILIMGAIDFALPIHNHTSYLNGKGKIEKIPFLIERVLCKLAYAFFFTVL